MRLTRPWADTWTRALVLVGMLLLCSALHAGVIDSSGHDIVVSPCGYTPVAGSQIGLPITSSTPLTMPPGATCAVIQSIGGTAYYTTASTETPTVGASGGNQLSAGSALFVPTLASLQGLHFIGVSGVTINVGYFK